MKIVIFGLTLSSSWENGHATLWRGLCRALAQRGHKLVFFERDVPYYAAHRHVIEWADGELLFYPEFDKVRYLARKHLAEADVAIVTWDCPDASAASQMVFESAVPLRVFHALDATVTLGQLSAEENGYPRPEGLADYDLVLSSIGGRALDDLLRRFSARRVAPLYAGVDPAMHRPAAVDKRFCSDLSYLGTYDVDLQPKLEALLATPAQRMAHRRFLIGGRHFPESFPWTENMSYFRDLQATDHAGVYSSSRIALHLTPPAKRAIGYCPSSRLFEAAACGAAILSDGWEGLGLFFEPGAEILTARNAEDVAAVMELPDAQLAQIGRRARERVLDEHTVAHRARHLETVLEYASRAPEEEQLSAVRTAGEELAEGEAWTPVRRHAPVSVQPAE